MANTYTGNERNIRLQILTKSTIWTYHGRRNDSRKPVAEVDKIINTCNS